MKRTIILATMVLAIGAGPALADGIWNSGMRHGEVPGSILNPKSQEMFLRSGVSSPQVSNSPTVTDSGLRINPVRSSHGVYTREDRGFIDSNGPRGMGIYR